MNMMDPNGNECLCLHQRVHHHVCYTREGEYPTVSSSQSNSSGTGSSSGTPIPGNINSPEFTTAGGNPFASFELNSTNNCTLYAWGRAYQITGKSLGIKNGPSKWIQQASNNGWQTGSKLRGPAVAVFTGHVAIIESVTWNSNGVATIIITEGGVGSKNFIPREYTNLNYVSHYEKYSGEFLGYIYLN